MRQEELLRQIKAAFQEGRFRFTVHSLKEATADDIARPEILHGIMAAEAEL